MSVCNREVFLQTSAAIESWKKPLLISHARPDGDALGALLAMRSLLQGRGADATVLLFDSFPERYRIFRHRPAMPVWGIDLGPADLADVDCVILLDTCTYNQIEPIADWLRSTDVPKLAVDHHATRDELADHYLVDQSAAAACLILYEWASAMDWPIAPEAAEALFVGIATDTGWFKHSNTDHRVLTAVADLTRRGVRPHELHQRLFQCETPPRVRLLGAALTSLELFAENRLAVMPLSAAAISAAGATPADTEDIINEPLRIGAVEVSVLLVEAGDGVIRASFRSKPPPDRAEDVQESKGCTVVGKRSTNGVDVAQAAQAFGGGGHVRAAGARIRGSLADVRRAIVEHLESILSD